MSFFTRNTGCIIIGGNGSFMAGLPELMTEDATLTEDGWDTLSCVFAIRRPTLTAEELAVLFPRGGQLGPQNWAALGLAGPMGPYVPALGSGMRNWYCVSSRPVAYANGVCIAEVGFKGWASSKATKVRFGAAAQVQSATDATISGTFHAKVEVHQNVPTVTVSYLGTGGANLANVGTACTPAGVTLPTVTEFWSGLADPVFHYPNGWVLMASEEDRIPGVALAAISDTYQFIRAYTP